ncbi:MAG: hypothetical protein NTW87_16860 [Planctomycetota bacterium]|nr:hypothetical protein [Planctomycetota bacterium]
MEPHLAVHGCICVLCLCCLASCGVLPAGEPALRIETGAKRAEITALSWDTEGTGRDKTNLLRPNTMVGLRIRSGGQWHNGIDLPTRVGADDKGGKSYWITAAPDAEVNWLIAAADGKLTLLFSGVGAGLGRIDGFEIVFPFAPGVTPVTALANTWNEDGSFQLPAIISAPDFGQMYLSAQSSDAKRAAVLKARLDGSRKDKLVNLVLELALPQAATVAKVELKPVVLPKPAGLNDDALWLQARRGWFSIWQPSARWGDQGNPFSAPAGMLANNVVSDPASCSLWFYADQALWTPDLAPGVSVMPLVRRTIEFWLDKRTRPSGEVICYWDYGNFLDANAGPLIASWDYVEATGDDEWLRKRIEKLEFIADFLAKRDVDGDGMVEATQSGNRGTLKQPARSCAWWDALNCGHKDSYTNALIYRAWRCLAELESRLHRAEQQARYTLLADKLKSAYARTLLNPATGWLAWWKSADGELHDYASPVINGLAIEYGLVEPAQGREILARLRRKMDDVGFKRFDLGVPPMLVPVLRADYLLPDGFGIPRKEDGTDTVGQYMNGGITAGQVLHFLAAHYVVGDPEPADRILRAMLERQGRGGFQNGVRDEGGKGIDWTTWDGKPSGYEGYLADSFRFLQAVLLREAPFRERLYRPLRPR